MSKSVSMGLLFTLITSYILAQQGQITGFVKTDTGEPLPMATVKISGTPLGTISGNQGYYQITNLPFGTHTVEVTFVGYQISVSSITVNSSKPYVERDFVLHESSEALAEIQIVSDVMAEQKKAGFAIEAVSLKPIQIQSVDLNKVLDQTAGIRVRQEGGLGSRVNYAINGLGGKAVRFFLDGVPMDYFGSVYSVNTIPASMIDRVEVYKGVVPASLASDALGGAINLVTRKANTNQLTAAYSFGSFNTHRASVLASHRHHTSGFTTRLSAFYNYSDNDYQVWGNDIYVTDPLTLEVKRGIKVKRFHDGFTSRSVKTDVGFTQKKWADQFYAGLMYADLKKELQHGTTMEVPYGEARYNQQVVMPYLVFQKYNWLAKGLDVNLFHAYSQLQRQLTDTSRNIYNWLGQVEGKRTLGGERSRTLSELSEGTWINRVSLEYGFLEHHKFGIHYLVSLLTRKEDDALITEKNDGYWAPQYLTRHNAGLSWQSTWLNEKLTASLFSKFFSYHADIKTTEVVQGVPHYGTAMASASSVGYGVASSYEVNDQLQFTASYEKTFRMPEAEEILGDGMIVRSTTTLKPESSHNVNAGVKLQNEPTNINRFFFSSNAFLRSVTDLIQQWQYDLGLFVYINFDKVQMQGVDGKLEYRYRELLSIVQTVSYLYPLIKSDTDELGNNNLIDETRLPNTPFLQSNTEARLSLKNLIQKNTKTFLYINSAYVGEFYKHAENIGQFNKDKIPTQWTVGAGVGYSFPREKIAVAIDVNNIFNQQVFDNYAIQKPGRSVFIKLTYSIQ